MSRTYRVFDRHREKDFSWKKKLSRNGSTNQPSRNHRYEGVREDGVLVTRDGISETQYRSALKREEIRRIRRDNKRFLRDVVGGNEEE